MAIVNFTATKSLASGYSYGDPVQITFVLQELDKKFASIKTKHKSMSGAIFYRHHRDEITFSLKSEPVVSAQDNEMMAMFLDSVSDGSNFTADWYSDTAGSESNYVIDGGYTQSRVHAQIFEYSFKVISQ